MHGAYAVVGITGRAQEITEGLVEAMVAEGTWRPSFAPTVQVCSVLLVRIDCGQPPHSAGRRRSHGAGSSSYVGEAGETIEKLRRDLRGWTNAARGYLAELGLTPAALARSAVTRASAVRPGRRLRCVS